MTGKVQPIPAGYHSVTPYLVVRGVDRLIDFMQQAFGAVEKERHTRPDGVVMHAELKVGDSIVMMGEAPEPSVAAPGHLYLYVEDVDRTYRRALDAGGTSVREPADQFYGDRSGGVKDPSGNTWWISTHVEDVPPEELERRQRAAQHG